MSVGTSITALASIALIVCIRSSRYSHSLTTRSDEILVVLRLMPLVVLVEI